MKILFKTVLLSAFAVITVLLSSYRVQKNGISLSEKEKNSLLFMLEEEKLAFDVYSRMDEKWGTMQFGHIKQSEIMHMDAVKAVLDANKVKYSLLEAGKFRDKNLQKLYNSLIVQGNRSEVEALKAGAKIEDVDLYDLIRLKKETDNSEIIRTYNFLECGSRNHLRAFTRGLSRNNATYSPEFISQADYETILNNDQERCGQQFGNRQNAGKGGGNGQGKMHHKSCGMNQQGNYGQMAETGESFCCGKCE